VITIQKQLSFPGQRSDARQQFFDTLRLAV